MSARLALAGRAVAITGAAGGIGAALARAFAAKGARVALLDLPGPALDALATELGAPAFACDVTDAAACRRALDAAAAALGGLDVLVANAGITHLGRVADTDPAVLRRVMDVNCFGALHCAQAALPHLVARGGQVVVISSVAGFAPLAGRAGYAASKHALHGLFGSLRVELAPRGVGVTLVCPSFVATDIGKHALGPDGGAAHAPRTTTGRAADPADVAAAIVRAIERRARLVVLSPVGKASWWLVRAWPAAYEWIMGRLLYRDADFDSPNSRPPD